MNYDEENNFGAKLESDLNHGAESNLGAQPETDLNYAVEIEDEVEKSIIDHAYSREENHQFTCGICYKKFSSKKYLCAHVK